jgi:hypothetical protein
MLRVPPSRVFLLNNLILLSDYQKWRHSLHRRHNFVYRVFPPPAAHIFHHTALIWYEYFGRYEILCQFLLTLAQLITSSVQVGQKFNVTKRNLIPSKYIRCCIPRAALDCLSERDITISHNIATVGHSTQPLLLLSNTFRSPFTFLSYRRVSDLVKACVWISCESQNKDLLCLYMRLTDSL